MEYYKNLDLTDIQYVCLETSELLNEQWKDVPKYVGKYQISNLGRIKSLSYSFFVKQNNSYSFYKEKILSQYLTKKKYLRIDLSKTNNKKQKFLVHRLVAIAFIENIESKKQINHKNCIKTDNRVENLEWCTNSENQIHAIQNGLRKIIKGVNHKCSKLSEKEVLEIREMKKTNSYSEIAKKYKIGITTYYRIINRESWKHI